jgi:hypothetical protein
MKSCRATALWALMMMAALVSPGLAQVVDDFNRTSLGSNWTADTEYKIVSNTLDNSATTTGWTFLAVYNAAINPYQVQFTWASTADASGINAGGFAMLLDAASVSANGFMIFRRDATLEINPIVNGNVDRTVVVASTAATLASPTKGSVIKIGFRTDATKAYFDYYINGTLDGTLSYLRASYAAIPSTYYAGVSLYGNMNNNIDDFTVWGQSITISSPNGGESWLANSTHAITWSSNGYSGTVAIDYSLNGGSTWTAITASTTNTGSYSWTLPGSTTTTGRVRVRDASDSNPADISDANFTITPQTESITVLSPNGGENWEVNGSHEITWSSTGAISSVRIFYSADNGANWTIIVASTTNDGSYAWTAPGVTTTQGLIRIADASDGLPTDESNATFSVLTLATLYVRDTSGQPGSTSNLVTVCLDNITPIRGVSFKLTDSPAYLTAMNVLPTGRASDFTVTKSDNGTSVTIMVVSMAGSSIATGSGPICLISYDVSGSAPLGEFSSLDFANVVVSDDSSEAVLPDLLPGKFWFVKMGDLDNGGTVDILDINRAADIVLGRPPQVTENELMSGDLDHDGDMDLFDLLTIWELVY